MTSRRYIKRIWRVPKDRGATECLATLIVKSLRKHGWPADFVLDEHDEWAFTIQHYDTGLNARDDFWQAVDIACRVMARLRKVDLIQAKGFCELARPYGVNERGEFRPIKT